MTTTSPKQEANSVGRSVPTAAALFTDSAATPAAVPEEYVCLLRDMHAHRQHEDLGDDFPRPIESRTPSFCPIATLSVRANVQLPFIKLFLVQSNLQHLVLVQQHLSSSKRTQNNCRVFG